MSKILQLSMVVLLMGSLAACGTSKTSNETATNETVKEETTNKGNETVKEEETTTEKAPTKNEHKIELADDVADKIVAEMKEVKKAHVFVTNKNAYVAVTLKEGVNGDKALEDKIAEHVRAENAHFKNVYVSLNPDFVKEMTQYGEKIRANEPVEGFYEEFTNTLKRVFPNAH